MVEYKGGHIVGTSNNSRLPIAHIGSTFLTPQYNPQKVALQDMYYIPSLKKYLLSISQLTSSGHYVLFGPQAVKIYQNLKILGTPTIEQQKLESFYVLPVESTYVDKTQMNETIDLWHDQLGHISYHKLKIIINKLMLKKSAST